MSATGQHREAPELARAMGPVARELLGEPTEEKPIKHELRFRSRGSLCIDTRAGTYFDFEAGKGGGVLELVQAETGLDKDGAVAWLAERGHIRRPASGMNIVAEYPYTDASGQLLFEVVRLDPKSFRQRRPDPSAKDGWTWNLGGVQRVVYRLPELLDASGMGEPVFVVEGEKAADALAGLGLAGTCSPGGANKWRPEFAQWFNGADVLILPDNDEPGRQHAELVLHSLKGAARRVRTISLPGLPEKGDVFDWIQAGGTADQLLALADGIPQGAEQDGHRNAEMGQPSDAPHADPALREYLSAEAWAERAFPPPVRLLGDLVTSTTRIFLVGATGVGKTMLGFALAAGIATGTGFLQWRSDRPGSVLYVDGEMPGELVKGRLQDAMRRLGGQDLGGNLFIYAADTAEALAEQFPQLGVMQPLNTEAGQDFVYALIDMLGGVDVVIFDNVMSLIAGDQKDEIPWSETLPLVAGLTRRHIGQIWLDHAGHNTSRQYGSSTKAWRFDAVGIMTELPQDERTEGETAFKLSFDAPGKARRRTPDNWAEFAPRVMRLRDDEWQSETEQKQHKRGKVRPSRAMFHTALLKAIVNAATGPDRTTLTAWETECLRDGLLEQAPDGEEYRARDARRKAWRNAKHDLLAAEWITVDGQTVRDLVGRQPR